MTRPGFFDHLTVAISTIAASCGGATVSMGGDGSPAIMLPVILKPHPIADQLSVVAR